MARTARWSVLSRDASLNGPPSEWSFPRSVRSLRSAEALMSVFGPFLRWIDGQSMSALPDISDINLFRYREGIIYLNAKVSDGAFNFCVSEQELHCP